MDKQTWASKELSDRSFWGWFEKVSWRNSSIKASLVVTMNEHTDNRF